MKALLVTAALALAAASGARAAPVESFVEAPGPIGPLKGTMLQPGPAGAPVVLMIQGSGPVDRDGNSPAGLKAASSKLLAEALAAKGIATVRTDKRGMFASAGAIADPNKASIEEYAADAHAWIATIRKATGARCVWIYGHSEGGLVALQAGQDPEGVCGLILVSTAGRPLGEVVRSQLHASPGLTPELLAQADSAIDALEAGKHVDVAPLAPPWKGLFSPAIQDFWIDVFKLDPAKLAAAYHGPVLIVQGERDLQIGVDDAKRLKAAQPAAQMVLLPNVNHVLKVVESDARGANLAAYSDPSLPIAPAVVDAIAGFVQGGKPQR